MKRIAGHFILLVVLVFGAWLLLRQIDYRSAFHIEELGKEAEQKLSELILDQLNEKGEEIKADSAWVLIDSIEHRLCSASGIADTAITLHLLRRDEVNAVALPGGHLVVYTGIIKYCHSPEELAGVLAHETGHIQQGHIMTRLRREVGVSMLATLAGGDAGNEIARETARLLTSSAFDREMESEADKSAVGMMAKAGIDPVHFADVLFRLSHEKGNVAKEFEWISSHPNTQERAAEVLKLRKNVNIKERPVLSGKEWGYIQEQFGTGGVKK